MISERRYLRFGWLSPTAEFVECEYADHLEAAFEIVKSYTNKIMSNPDDYLLKEGWIKIGRNLGSGKVTVYTFRDYDETPEQIMFLKENYHYEDLDVYSREIIGE